MKRLNVLLVDDNVQDALLINELFTEKNFLNKLYHVENGCEAIQFLNKEQPYKEVVQPDLILMDINMPVMGGHEALIKIKSMPSVKHIPVLMLTTSSRKEDILKAYKEHSNSYIIKPDDIFELDNLIETIKNYWSNIVSFPND